MSDYRDWCGSCHQEINFGGHAHDCDWLHSERIARKELQEFEKQLRGKYNSKSDDELIAEAVALHDEIRALDSMLRGKEKKWDFLRRDVLAYDRPGVLDKIKEKLGRRYL